MDEAHRRRKDFLQPTYRPNRLLSLLNDLDEHHRDAGLLLLTATPMPVHPLEVWDLLTVLGMGGQWGADEGNFLRFFGEMRRRSAGRLGVHLRHGGRLSVEGGELGPRFSRAGCARLGPVKWSTFEDLPRARRHRRALEAAWADYSPHVIEMTRRACRSARAISRNTRDLLREYRERGILKDSVPTRRPRIERVPMRADERALYERVEEYITHFYQKYESERHGLGFVMTVYRRRLTSSFWAVRCSLERRLEFLSGAAGVDTWSR